MSSWLHRTRANCILSLVLLFGAINSYATVICLRSDGSRTVETTDGGGHCKPCPAPLRSERDSERAPSHTCVDLPVLIFSSTKLPTVNKEAPPQIKWLPLPVLPAHFIADPQFIPAATLQNVTGGHEKHLLSTHTRSVVRLI